MLRVATLLLSAKRFLRVTPHARAAIRSMATMEASPEVPKKASKPKKSPARRTAQVVKDAAMEEKTHKIMTILQTLYPDPPIPLDHVDSFQLLVAVVLSAQASKLIPAGRTVFSAKSTDKMVNKVTPALFQRAPTPEAMAATPIPEIQALIREVGLAPSKAKYLQGLAAQLIERHDGKVPRTLEELEALPGVGHKTAGVMMSQGFGVPAFPVDTHIHRLAQRWGLTNGHSVEQTEADLMSLIPKDRWTAAHLQIIFFGREHCPAQRHDPDVCPICSFAGVDLKDGPAKASGKRPSMAARLAAAEGNAGGGSPLPAVAEGGAEGQEEPQPQPAGKKRKVAVKGGKGKGKEAVVAVAVASTIDLGAAAAAGASGAGADTAAPSPMAAAAVAPPKASRKRAAGKKAEESTPAAAAAAGAGAGSEAGAAAPVRGGKKRGGAAAVVAAAAAAAAVAAAAEGAAPPPAAAAVIAAAAAVIVAGRRGGTRAGGAGAKKKK